MQVQMDSGRLSDFIKSLWEKVRPLDLEWWWSICRYCWRGEDRYLRSVLTIYLIPSVTSVIWSSWTAVRNRNMVCAANGATWRVWSRKQKQSDNKPTISDCVWETFLPRVSQTAMKTKGVDWWHHERSWIMGLSSPHVQNKRLRLKTKISMFDHSGRTVICYFSVHEIPR